MLTNIRSTSLSQLLVILQVIIGLDGRLRNTLILGIISTGIFFYAVTTSNFAFIITSGILFGFSIFLGFTVMLNLGGEIIYPEPEVTGSTLILMLANGFTFVMAEILAHLTLNFKIIYRNVLDGL